MNKRLMILKKHLNRKDRETGKEFYRYDITIDPKIVSELKWRDKQKLKTKLVGRKLVIEKE